jgi:precorrin-8X/cobalt-precorrin-8 methylmutase
MLGRPPEQIERESLLTIETLLSGQHLGPPLQRALAQRLVYASGDVAMAPLVRVSAGALERGVAALRGGGTVVCDVRMVAAGINARQRSRLGVEVVCASGQGGAEELASARETTRTAAGMLLLAQRMQGAVIAVGNAPTALLVVLGLVESGEARPALVIGMPVGFIAAAESKEALQQSEVPFVTVQGTRGGSALAVATVNLLLRWAEQGPP